MAARKTGAGRVRNGRFLAKLRLCQQPADPVGHDAGVHLEARESLARLGAAVAVGGDFMAEKT